MQSTIINHRLYIDYIINFFYCRRLGTGRHFIRYNCNVNGLDFTSSGGLDFASALGLDFVSALGFRLRVDLFTIYRAIRSTFGEFYVRSMFFLACQLTFFLFAS